MFVKKWFCTTTDDVTDDVTTTTHDVRNLNMVISRAFVYGGFCPRTPRPVSDDDTVDNFSVDELGYFPFFPILKELKKNRPWLKYDYRER